MKIFKKLVGLIVAMSICLSASIMTVSAYTYERLYNKTDEQIEEYLWRQITYVSDYSQDKDSFAISLTYAELKDFLSELEIPDSNYNDEDAYNDFLKWMQAKNPNGTITIEEYGDGYIQYDKDNPDEKLYWAYVSNTDEWVCKDEDGKTVRTVDVYHSDNETSSTTTSSKPTEQSSMVSTTSNSGGTVSAEPQPDYPGSTPAMPDSPGSSPVDEPASESPDSNTEVSSSPADVPATDSTVSESTDSPATEEAVADQTVSAEEVEPNNNNAMQTVLIIIGILIIAGIIVIIVMLNKRKREDNNGK